MDSEDYGQHNLGNDQAVNGNTCETCGRSSLIENLLKTGPERLPDALDTYQPPSWYDSTKFKRGQRWFHRNFLCIIVSNLVGLLCLLSCKTILQVLIFTRRSSTVKTAFRRYLHTINHIRLWYSQDIFDPSTRASASVRLVRRMHTQSHGDARNAVVAFPSQTDMVVTQWAFFGLVLTHGDHFGFKCRQEDEEGLVHFWKVVGYLMGIEDRFNLAFGSVEEVRVNCHAVVHQIILPGMTNPPDDFSSMSEALLEGVHLIVPVADPSAFMNYTRRVLGLKIYNHTLSSYSKWIFNLMIWNFSRGLFIPVIGGFLRWLENELLIFALFICNTFPIVHPKYIVMKNTVINACHCIIKIIKKFIKSILTALRLQSS